MAINESTGSAIIIAGNGMCTAGRIKHHLKHNLWRDGASLVIVGFQAKGTTGRRLVEGAKHVKIFRENVTVKAKIFTIGGFSAHADQNDLLAWIAHFESNPKVFVVHGEPSASEALAQKIRERFDFLVHIPKWKERLILKPKELGFEAPPAEAPKPDMKEMLLNGIVDLEKELTVLKRRVRAIPVEETFAEDELERLKYVQEEIRTIVPRR
jgi:metallo-beta-lactamase family protein